MFGCSRYSTGFGAAHDHEHFASNYATRAAWASHWLAAHNDQFLQRSDAIVVWQRGRIGGRERCFLDGWRHGGAWCPQRMALTRLTSHLALHATLFIDAFFGVLGNMLPRVLCAIAKVHQLQVLR